MKKKRILLGIALASASIFALAACSNGSPEPEPTPSGDEESTKATVTFNTNGGSAVASQEIDKGDKATRPATDPTKDGFVFLGWYTNAEGTGEAFDFNTAINANITLYAKWKVYDPFEDYVQISTKAEFIDFITGEADYIEDNVCDKNIILTADIDLTGEDLTLSVVTFKGTFDGQGHIIKNAIVNGDKTEQSGLLFEKLEGSAVVKNLRFLGVAVTGEGRWLSILTGLCNGDVTFDGIEFNACNIVNTNTNAAFLFARNTTVNTITVKNITVKNNSYVHTQEYGGLVAGDIIGGSATSAGSTVNFENLDVAGELWSKGTGALVTGRCRDYSIISIKNAVVTGKLMSADGSKTNEAAGGSCAAVAGGNKQLTSLTMENVYSNVEGAKNVMNCKSNSGTPTTITNCFTAQALNDKDNSDPAVPYFTQKTDAITTAWLKDTLKLNFTNVWMTEGTDNAKYRLVNSTTNVRSAGATLSEISAVTGGAKVRYHKGDEFSTQGLVVMGAFSDGVQLVLQSDEYEIISTAYTKDTKGTYEIVVKSTEDTTKSVAYNVRVVEQTGFEINTVEVNKLYVKGTDFSKDGLGVYSVWDDNKKELEASPTIDSSAYQKNTAGEYEISVSHGGFTAKTFKVSVVDTAPIVVDDYFYVNVDASATVNYSGEKVNGVETFKSVGDAVAYLTAYKTELADATKVIRVAPGTYREKIDINLDDVVLVGTGTNATDTKIVYNAVESTYSVKAKKTFGLNGATLNVNGANFKADNIAIWNDFDYINDAAKEASPQGLALTINGDKAVLNNVDLFGNQDTFYAKHGRVYFNNSKIAGNVDFIFGENDGLVYFNNCVINAVYRGNETNNGYVTAMRAGRDGSSKVIGAPTYGYIFYQCTFTADTEVKNGTMGLARPWGDKATVAFIECDFSAAYAKEGFGNTTGAKPRWDSMNGYPQDAFFVEYGNTGEGSITTAVTGGRILTATEAANYTVENLFAPTNGEVSWKVSDVDDPFDYQAALTALATEKTVTTTTSSIYASSPADDTTTADVIDITIQTNKTFDVTYYAKPWNTTNKTIQFEYDDTLLEVVEDANGKCTIKGIAQTAGTTFVIKQGSVSTTVNVVVTAPTGTNTVTFMDGTTSLGTASGAEGVAIDFTQINTTKAGYQFVKWYEDAALTKEFIGTTIPNADKTVYARYYELEKAGVTYVSTASELTTILNDVSNNQYTVYLTADIDMTGVTYNGITVNNNSSFYGNGYAIKNWTPTYSANKSGFFGVVYSGTIDSIVFKDCTISDGGTALQYIGLLAGQVYTSETISKIEFNNCVMNTAKSSTLGLIGEGIAKNSSDPNALELNYVRIVGGSVAGTQYVGGLFGRDNNALTASYVEVSNFVINPTNAAIKNSGGLIGKCQSTIKLDYVNASLTFKGDSNKSDQYDGGLIGYMESSGVVEVDHTNASITATVTKIFGAITGRNKSSSKLTVKNSDIVTNISLVASDAQGTYIGGVVGQGEGEITVNDVNIDITVNAAYSIGGVVGDLTASTATVTVSNVFVTGSITVSNSAADYENTIVGHVNGTLSNPIDYSTCSYKNFTITGATSTLQGSEASD